MESLFYKVASLQACNFIKKKLQHRSFPVYIAKYLTTAFFSSYFLNRSYCFEEAIGFDGKASFASRPVSRLISWYNKHVIYQKSFDKKLFSSTRLFMDWKLQTVLQNTSGGCFWKMIKKKKLRRLRNIFLNLDGFLKTGTNKKTLCVKAITMICSDLASLWRFRYFPRPSRTSIMEHRTFMMELSKPLSIFTKKLHHRCMLWF